MQHEALLELREALRLLHLVERDDILALQDGLTNLDVAGLLPPRLFSLRECLATVLHDEEGEGNSHAPSSHRSDVVYPTTSRSVTPAVYPTPSPSAGDDSPGEVRVMHFVHPDDHNRGATRPKKKKKTARAWKTADNPHIPVTATVESVVALLAAARWDSETYNIPRWVCEVADELRQNPLVFQDESLASIVGRLSNLESLGLRVSFLTMVNNIQVVAKCRNLQLRKGYPDLKAVYDKELAHLPNNSRPSLQQFRMACSSGAKFAALAAGGSVYILILIAGLRLRSKIASLPGDMPSDIARFLRAAPDGPSQVLVKECIAPTIRKMQVALPLRMSSIFTRQVLEEHQQTHEFDCTDLKTSDAFFDSLCFNQFCLLGRNPEVWGYQPVDSPMSQVQSIQELMFHTLTPTDFQPRPYSPPLTDVDNVLPSLPVSPVSTQQSLPQGTDGAAATAVDQIVMETQYDRDLPMNKCRQAPKDQEENRQWTERERALAANAEPTKDLHDLTEKLAEFYPGGAKHLSRPYLRISSSSFPNSQIKICDKDKSLQTFVSTTLPPAIRSVLHASFNACLSDVAQLQDADSKEFGQGSPRFVAIHCSFYNCHTTQGHNAPSDVHPYWLQREDGSRVNYTQLIPYLSREASDHWDALHDLQIVFADLFEHIRHEVAVCLPDEYHMLSVMADILPGNEVPPAYPFQSLVLNLNVITTAHRDPMDCQICLVLSIGDFIGGELCMVETGLVVELQPGDFVVFRSSEITHFNLHYRGQRASLVLSTDKHMKRWAEDRNGWNHNVNFQ